MFSHVLAIFLIKLQASRQLLKVEIPVKANWQAVSMRQFNYAQSFIQNA